MKQPLNTEKTDNASSIAEKQGISESYLEQLLVSLRNAGLIKSSRGAQGGYQLTKDPKDIRIGDIIRILEGPIAPTECVITEETDCRNADKCVTRLIWKEVKESLEGVLDNITLQDMCDKAKGKMIN